MVTTDEIALMRAQHYDDHGSCYECYQDWPCDVVTLLAALDAAQRQLALADAVMALYDGPLSADHELWCDQMAFAVLDYRKARGTSAGAGGAEWRATNE